MYTPMNLVVIIREVGREVCLFSHPVTFDLVAARFSRMVRSMSLQISRARMSTSPRASIRRGDLRNGALTKR